MILQSSINGERSECVQLFNDELAMVIDVSKCNRRNGKGLQFHIHYPAFASLVQIGEWDKDYLNHYKYTYGEYWRPYVQIDG